MSATKEMVSGFDSSLKTQAQTLNITYEGKTTTFNISVLEPIVSSIRVISDNHKKSYWVGEALDVNELKIEATYSNGEKENISVTKEMVSGFDSSVYKTSQELTIRYEGKMRTYFISVINENTYLRANVLTYDLEGKPYQDPVLKLEFSHYAGSFIELSENNTYVHLSVLNSPSIKSRVTLSGTYELVNEKLTLTPSSGNPLEATFKDGKIIIKSKTKGSVVGGVPYPDYFIEYTYMQN